MSRARLNAAVAAISIWALLAEGAPARARSEAELREIIQDVLAQQHPREGAEWWRSLGPDAPKLLIAMYRESTHIYERMRLLHALGWFDDPSAVEFLKAEARKTEEDVIRNAAVRAVATSQGAREADWVGEFLKHEDADTRYAAAEALSAMNDAGATRKVENHLSQEKTPWIGEKLRKAQARAAAASGTAAVVEPPVDNQRQVKLDQLAPELAGVWEGFRISESRSGELVSERMVVELFAPAGAGESWSGLVRTGPAASKSAKLGEFRSIVGKANRFRAVFVASDKSSASGAASAGSAPKEKALGVSVEAESFGSPTGQTLELRAPEKGLFLIVKKKGSGPRPGSGSGSSAGR